MFEDVESYLTNHIGADATSYLLEALSLLDQIGYQDHLFPLRNMMADVDNHDSAENVGYIRSIINDNYILILRSMSVEVAEETPLSALYDLLFTLSNVEGYENKLELKAIIDEGFTSEEIISHFIRVFRGTDPSNSLEYIVSVSTDLIERLDDLCQKEIRNNQEGQYRSMERVKKNAKRFFELYPETYVRELIRNGYSIGPIREQYLKALEEHFSHFDPGEVEVAKELLAVAIVTDFDGNEVGIDDNPLGVAKTLTDSFVQDASAMIKVNSIMERIYSEVFSEER